jgi:hypothetical protein
MGLSRGGRISTDNLAIRTCESFCDFEPLAGREAGFYTAGRFAGRFLYGYATGFGARRASVV